MAPGRRSPEVVGELFFVIPIASFGTRRAPTRSAPDSIDRARSGCLSRPRLQVRSVHPRVRMTHPAHHSAGQFFLRRAARGRYGRATITTPRSWMAFAAGEQGRHAALLHALCHREKQAVVSTALLQTRVSEAALGCARLHARVAACLHGVSRPYSCCQANVGRFWRRSLRSSGQRASCHVHRTLLHRRNVIMCSVRGRWPPQASGR